MPQNDDVCFTTIPLNLTPSPPPPPPHHKFLKSPFNPPNFFKCHFNPPKFSKFHFNPLNFLKFHFNPPNRSTSPLLCSASLSLSQSEPQLANNGSETPALSNNSTKSSNFGEERVLISEVWVRNKDGEELERKELEGEALNVLKACRPTNALTSREVQEDVHRIMATGYFCSCLPVAVDTRDGIRIVFQVEPNQEFQGLVCEGANVLPAKFVEDAFRDGYGKVVNIRRLDDIISSINGWYMERGLFGMVSGIEILSGGMIRLQVSEAEVNDISIRFVDKTMILGQLFLLQSALLLPLIFFPR
ncbi:hypothetical protein Leryth_009615 [Lithospermum erythrorhizon]|nr:hypothetical protein Leryth_009615 [Lithospermum erythrorhizon]